MGNSITRNNRFRPNTSRDTTLPEVDFMHGIELCLKYIMVAIFVALTTLLFIFIENAVTQSNLLAIKEISVSGTHVLSKEEVIEQAEIFPEDNIFALNLRHTRLKIIAHPWIEDASVKRSLPSKIIITIKEETPIAVVHIPDRADIILNYKGVPFTENDAIGSDIFINDIRNSTAIGKSDNAKNSNITRESVGDGTNTTGQSDDNGASSVRTITDTDKDNTNLTLPVVTGLRLSKHGEVYGFSGRVYDSVMSLLRMKKSAVIQKILADDESGIEVDLIIGSDSVFKSVDQVAVQQPVKIKIGFDNYEEKFKIIRHIVNYMQKNKRDKQVCSIDLINPENVVIKVKDITVNALPEHIEGGA